MASWLSHERFPRILFGVGAVVFVLLGISPHDRSDWLLESALLVVGVGALWLSRHGLRLSRASYLMIFLFSGLHMIGAHYTYSLVPYREWLGLEPGARNHFDRFVHLLYGFLLAYPVREVFLRVADVRGFWGYYLPLDVVMSTSVIYELIEWAAAEVFGGELGVAYLGTQGDVWDAQKDMALATLGAVLAMGITGWLNWRYQRDFAREWIESLRVKRPEPLGEDALARLRRE